MASQKDPSRSCGECSECCTVTHVTSDSIFKPQNPHLPIWHKPERQSCQFINTEGEGCAIFNSTCPSDCREFYCEWLRGKPLRKPTESGVIFFTSNTQFGNPTIMVGARTDAPYEDEETKKEIQSYREKGYPVLLMHDNGGRTIVE